MALTMFLAKDPAMAWPSLCPLHHLKLWCPGCGLGTGICHLMHGNWLASWEAHPLAGLALLTIAHRIIALTRKTIYSNQTN